jgi:putative flippase GtrA
MTPQRRILTFIAVGSTAAAVHWCTVVALVQAWGAAPLLANLGGWMVAFVISFSGQYHFTFRDHGAPIGQALRRFLPLSLAGFWANELGYAALLRWTPWPYWLDLGLVLVAVAVFTYLLSRRWAFRRN